MSFDRALAARPDDAEFHYNRGNILCEIGRLEEGLVNFDTAVALRPGEAEFYQNRGNVLLDMGRFAEAFADYDKALAINPTQKYLEGARLYTKMHLCDWSNLTAEGADVFWPVVSPGAAASPPFVGSEAMDSTCGWISSNAPRSMSEIGIPPSRWRTGSLKAANRTIAFGLPIYRRIFSTIMPWVRLPPECSSTMTGRASRFPRFHLDQMTEAPCARVC